MDGQPEPMDSEVVTSDEVPNPQLALPVVQLIKTAQSQYGLKHGDYGRYRQYCARRLRKLYTSLKMTHGRNKFQKRKVEMHHVTESRYLHIPLFNAERAWAQAMELKKMVEEKMELKQRHHMVRRLAKAALWASQLARLASSKCDTRSRIEAEAYASWMLGSVLLEKGKDWELALAKFGKAMKLMQELSKVGDLDQQNVCAQMVEDIEPSLRYCNYQISRQGGSVPDVSALLAMQHEHEEGSGGVGMDVLQSQLAALAAEAKSQQASSVSYVTWQGKKWAVKHDKVKGCLHQAQEYSSQLIESPGQPSTAVEARLALYDKLINSYNEALGHTRALLKGTAGSESEAQLEELQGLETAISGLLLEHTLRRGELLSSTLQERFLQQQCAASQGKKSKEKPVRPEDVIHIQDTLLHHCNDLNDLASRLGGRQGQEIMDKCVATSARYQAVKVVYVGHVLLASEKPLEAFAIFTHAVKLCQEAVEASDSLDSPERQEALRELKALEQQCIAYRSVAGADLQSASLASKEEIQTRIKDVSLKDTSAAVSPTTGMYLVDALHSWQSFAGQSGKHAHLLPMPYTLQAIPTNPIMLDTASNFIEYPSLQHRIKKESKSTFAKLFSWRS